MELDVVKPDDPPALTPAASRALLRVILAAVEAANTTAGESRPPRPGLEAA